MGMKEGDSGTPALMTKVDDEFEDMELDDKNSNKEKILLKKQKVIKVMEA